LVKNDRHFRDHLCSHYRSVMTKDGNQLIYIPPCSPLLTLTILNTSEWEATGWCR
jgi:hypothetical protein